MNAIEGWVIVAEWALTALGAVVFLAIYGWPGKYRDKTMSWHLAAMTADNGLDRVGLLLGVIAGRLLLIPSVLIYGAAMVVMYWRLWLLLAARRRRKR